MRRFRHTFLLFLLTVFLPLFSETPKAFASSLLTKEATSTPALSQLLQLFDIPQENLDQIVRDTQKSWLQYGKERWEFEDLAEDKRAVLLPLFQQIGLIDEVQAHSQEYDFALIHGARTASVVERINFLISEYERGVRFKQIVLLTGQRFLDTDAQEKLLGLQTETEMMLFVWNNAPMSEKMRKIPLLVIDAPRIVNSDGTSSRPNTQTTLIEWLKTKPEPGSCLFVSNQPFVGYQDAVARLNLPSAFLIETIGPPSFTSVPVSIYLDNLARWLYVEKNRRS